MLPLLSSTTIEEQWPCDLGRKWSLEEIDEHDIPGAWPPMQQRVHTLAAPLQQQAPWFMVLAAWGRKAGDPAKATDGPENRSVQVGQPGK